MGGRLAIAIGIIHVRDGVGDIVGVARVGYANEVVAAVERSPGVTHEIDGRRWSRRQEPRQTLWGASLRPYLPGAVSVVCSAHLVAHFADVADVVFTCRRLHTPVAWVTAEVAVRIVPDGWIFAMRAYRGTAVSHHGLVSIVRPPRVDLPLTAATLMLRTRIFRESTYVVSTVVSLPVWHAPRDVVVGEFSPPARHAGETVVITVAVPLALTARCGW